MTLRREHLALGEDQSFSLTLGGIGLFVLMVAGLTWWLSVRSATSSMAGYADDAKRAASQAETKADTAIKTGFASLNKELKDWQSNVEAGNAQTREDVQGLRGQTSKLETDQRRLTRSFDRLREQATSKDEVRSIVTAAVNERMARIPRNTPVSTDAVVQDVMDKIRFDRKEVAEMLAPELARLYEEQHSQRLEEEKIKAERNAAFNAQAIRDNNKKGKAKKWKLW